MKNVTLNDGLEEIEFDAFSDTPMTSITIPPSVKTIGNHAFGFDWTGKKLTDDFTVYGEAGSEAQRYAEKYGFTFVSVNYIKSVKLTFAEPKAGAYPDYNFSINTPYCEVMNLEALTPHGTGLEFVYTDEDGKSKMIAPNERFKEGVEYKPMISLIITRSNTKFAADAEVTFNGKKADTSPISDTWISASLVYDLSSLKKGDADGNGKVNINDATAVQKHVAKLITLTGDKLKAADADGNGVVNINDATIIQKYVAKLIPSLG